MLNFFSNPALWIGIGVFFVIIYAHKKTDNYIDVKGIIANHYSIFNKSIIQIMFFSVIPLLFAIGFTLAQTVTEEISDCLNVIFSIFVAMFFSILSILLSILSKDGKEERKENAQSKEYIKLIEQSNDTVIFEILLSVVLLFIILIYSLLPEDANNIIKVIFSVIIYYLTASVLLNIFILIKRLKSIFDNFNK